MNTSTEPQSTASAHWGNPFANPPAAEPIWESVEETEAAGHSARDYGGAEGPSAPLAHSAAWAQLAEEERRNSSAMTVSIAVALYILAGAVFFGGVAISSYLFEPAVLIGLVAALVICVAPTCMLVYNAGRWPRQGYGAPSEATPREENIRIPAKSKAQFQAVSSALWSVTVAVYLLISFVTSAWWITWIIFPVAAAIKKSIRLA